MAPPAESATIVASVDGLELYASRPVIYDRPVGLHLLHQDPATGAEHYLVRYPPGLTARPHTHSAAHTIVVLEGRLLVDGETVEPHGYVHFPAGAVQHHQPAADAGCVFVTIFHGPFDVTPVEGPARLAR